MSTNNICFRAGIQQYAYFLNHAYSNILKISPPKTESFQIKTSVILSYFCSKQIVGMR